MACGLCVYKTRSGREVYSVRRLVVTLPEDADGAPTCDMSDLDDDDDKSVTDDDKTDETDDTGSLDSCVGGVGACGLRCGGNGDGEP